MKQQKSKTPEEELVAFCDSLRPGGFAYLGPLQTLKANGNLIGFVVQTTQIQDIEKYLPHPEFPQAQPTQPHLYRDAVLAIFRANGLFTTKEIAVIILDGEDIQINPLLENEAISLEISCESPSTLWEKRMIIPMDIASCPEPKEIVLLH